MLRALSLLTLVVVTVLTTLLFSAPVRAREAVAFSGPGVPGTIVVRTNERRLYFVTGQGRAIRYTVGVGRADKQWFGTTAIASKHIRPAWSPPAEIRRGRPNYVIESGSPRNPMGAAALVLVDEELAITR
jgi:lipoprotein-anchoring transpeptidase ErfK/SrfK